MSAVYLSEGLDTFSYDVPLPPDGDSVCAALLQIAQRLWPAVMSYRVQSPDSAYILLACRSQCLHPRMKSKLLTTFGAAFLRT